MLTFLKCQPLLCLLLCFLSFFCAYCSNFPAFSMLIPLISQVLLLFQVCPFILSFLLKIYLLHFSVPFSLLELCFFFSLMVDYSYIRHTSPSVAFFFTRLGAFIGFSSGHCPRVGDICLGDSSLNLMLGDLYPLLCQSLGWFELV